MRDIKTYNLPELQEMERLLVSEIADLQYHNAVLEEIVEYLISKFKSTTAFEQK